MSRKKATPEQLAAYQQSQQFKPRAITPSVRSKGERGPSRIMYIELKSGDGHNDRGTAYIGRVTFSKSGKSIYYRDLKLQSLKGAGICANYFEVESGDEYWVSGCKKNGQDRHWAGGGPVEIDDDVRDEYWTDIRKQPEKKDEQFA
jgi:hypothetical protein